MAEKYALRFKKASVATAVELADDDDAMRNVDAANNSSETANGKKLHLKLDNIKVDMDKQVDRITSMEAKLDGVIKDISKQLDTMKHSIDAIAGALDSVKSKENMAEKSLTEAMKDTKAMVSTLFRNRR